MTWILTIVGVVLISVLVELFLPSGQLNKYIKGVLSIFIVYALLVPLTTFEIANITSIFNNNQSNYINYSFVEKINDEKAFSLKCQIENQLNENGYQGVKVFVYLTEEVDFKIKNIYINLDELVLLNESLNIDRYKNILNIVSQVANVGEELIIFDG